MSKKKEFTDEWRIWTAENMMIGCGAEGVLDTLLKNGFDKAEAIEEIKATIESPSYKVGRKYYSKLQKRLWLNESLHSLHSKIEGYGKIDILTDIPSYKDFLQKYYFANMPVVLKQAASEWPASKWTPEILKEKIGEEEVEVMYGRDKDDNYMTNHSGLRKKMKFSDFVDEVYERSPCNDLYMHALNGMECNDQISKIFEDIGKLGDGYLDESKTKEKSYLWFGPKGTFTKLHYDNNNSFFVQIHGQKRFRLIPSLQDHKMDYDIANYKSLEEEKPNADLKKITYDEVILDPGDVLFVPATWWHCVTSLDISISMTLMNADIEPDLLDFGHTHPNLNFLAE